MQWYKDEDYWKGAYLGASNSESQRSSFSPNHKSLDDLCSKKPHPDWLTANIFPQAIKPQPKVPDKQKQLEFQGV